MLRRRGLLRALARRCSPPRPPRLRSTGLPAPKGEVILTVTRAHRRHQRRRRGAPRSRPAAGLGHGRTAHHDPLHRRRRAPSPACSARGCSTAWGPTAPHAARRGAQRLRGRHPDRGAARLSGPARAGPRRPAALGARARPDLGGLPLEPAIPSSTTASTGSARSGSSRRSRSHDRRRPRPAARRGAADRRHPACSPPACC